MSTLLKRSWHMKKPRKNIRKPSWLMVESLYLRMGQPREGVSVDQKPRFKQTRFKYQKCRLRSILQALVRVCSSKTLNFCTNRCTARSRILKKIQWQTRNSTQLSSFWSSSSTQSEIWQAHQTKRTNETLESFQRTCSIRTFASSRSMLWHCLTTRSTTLNSCTTPSSLLTWCSRCLMSTVRVKSWPSRLRGREKSRELRKRGISGSTMTSSPVIQTMMSLQLRIAMNRMSKMWRDSLIL